MSEDSHSSEYDYFNGDISDKSNALKCKEYREKNKIKRREEELEYFREKEKNDKLKEIFSKKERDIKKLKAYYMDFIGGKKCLKRQCRKKLKPQKIQEDSDQSTECSTMSPLVMVKSEIELDADVLVKTEKAQEDQPSHALGTVSK